MYFCWPRTNWRQKKSVEQSENWDEDVLDVLELEDVLDVLELEDALGVLELEDVLDVLELEDILGLFCYWLY